MKKTELREKYNEEIVRVSGLTCFDLGTTLAIIADVARDVVAQDEIDTYEHQVTKERIDVYNEEFDYAGFLADYQAQ